MYLDLQAITRCDWLRDWVMTDKSVIAYSSVLP
jgi:hypothetical protein